MILSLLNSTLAIILLLLPPLLIAHRLTPSQNPERFAWRAALLTALFPAVIMLTLHTASIPITRPTLLITYGTLTLLLIAICHKHPLLAYAPLPPILLIGTLLLLLTIFPYTLFTGIDTYKWQDLATAIEIEKNIPWLVHPVSLFGFSPRAYPLMQPAWLASLQIIGDLGPEGGFRLLSIINALLGITTMTLLARRLFAPVPAYFAALAYAFSPVFIRYTHWATGRGMLLAILPLLILAALPDPIPNRKNNLLRRIIMFTTIATACTLAHKAAWVAIPILIVLMCIPLPPRKRPSPLMLRFGTLAITGIIIAIITSRGPPLSSAAIINTVRTAIVRFAWMLPFAITTWWLHSNNLHAPPNRRFLQLALIPMLILAFDPYMYGALIALPIITLLAMSCLIDHPPPIALAQNTAITIITLAAALTIIIQRSQLAATPELRRASQYLEQHEPEIPYQVQAPGIHRSRILAYVTGCARFTITPTAQPRLTWNTPPQQFQLSPEGWSDITAWLRNIAHLDNLQVDMYASPARTYHFIINNQGTAPANATLIYNQDNIQIHEQPHNH